MDTNQGYIVQETIPDGKDDRDDVETGEVFYIQGSIVALVERLDNEFTNSLKNIDHLEYVNRLRDEVGLYVVIVESIRYFTRLGMTDEVCRASLRRLEHIYYKVNNQRFYECKQEVTIAIMPVLT